MNNAQKSTWFKLVISLATLAMAAVVIVYLWRNEISVYDMSNPIYLRILGFVGTIPLIQIIILQMRFPNRSFDERDKKIAQKANAIGIVGAFVFLGGAGWYLSVITKMGSVRAPLICFLVYLACFVWILVSSVAAIVKYRIGGNKNE